LRSTFLELHPELWNQEGTILTLWLDPGRIKRDLQPNKLLGPPLVNGEQYEIIVSGKWPDVQGATLGKSYNKKMVATKRDSLSPSPSHWKLNLPRAGTNEPLGINIGEPLDYMLLQNSITLVDSAGTSVSGVIQISYGEKNFNFIPSTLWLQGQYRLQIASKLEDLSGNNLNRPFDRDLSRSAGNDSSKDFVELEWRID
jgi:hypothetical protein